MAEAVEFPEQNVVYAEDQPQYRPLPARKVFAAGNPVTTCWKLNWRERLFGRVYLTQLTFGQPLQPVRMEEKLAPL